MKKLTLILAAITLMAAQYADGRVVRSRTFGERSKAATEWIVRAGISLNNAAGSATSAWKDYHTGADAGIVGDASLGCNVGGDFSAAFNRAMGKNGLYWGMEFGIGSRGAKGKTEYGGTDWYENSTQSISTWNVKYSPFIFGYKYNLNEDMRLDAHLGVFASFDFAGSGKADWEYDDGGDEDKVSLGDEDLEGFQRFDAGMHVGIGFWWKRFNIDITYQRGFISAMDWDSHYDDFNDKSVYSSNLMLRLGVSF